MMRRGRDLDAKKRMLDRWRRQDEAARLRDRMPEVDSLTIALEEHEADDEPPVSHVRLVPVESAPALFEIPCTDKDCSGGVYDITQEVMSALQHHRKRFEGTQQCTGTSHDQPCARKLRYVGVARYRDKVEAQAMPRAAENASR